MRGIVGETLSPADAYAVGRSFGTIVARNGGSRVAVGYDGRLTSVEMAENLARGLNDAGIHALRIGRGPTPMLYFSVHHLVADGGIMVTGSHNPSDYNGVAGNLANRDAPPTGVSLTAFERSRIPTIATFDSFKANFMPTQAFTTASGYQIAGADQDHDPQATDANGNNVDNRTQTLNVDLGTGAVNEGDAFTIAGVFAVSAIHKNVTSQLQTFRVTSTASGTGGSRGR